MLRVDEVRSPVGTLFLVVRGEAVCALSFEDEWPGARELLRQRLGEPFRHEPNPAGITARLSAYLAGRMEALDDIAVDPGGTPFQRAVWTALRNIPPGTTASYAQLAEAVGQPKATRAVGTANGANPVAIIIPCHRVVRANGELGGYAGGVERKRWLLAHEAKAVGALAGTPLGAVQMPTR